MIRLIKLALVLGVLGFLGLSAYAYLGLKAPEVHEITTPVTLDAG